MKPTNDSVSLEKDEISLVVERFRPSPSFTISKVLEWESGAHKRSRRNTKDFSAVYYHGSARALHITYLYEGGHSSFIITMKIQVEAPYEVALLSVMPQCEAADLLLRHKLIGIRDAFRDKPNQKQSPLSLFAVTSNLLKALNNLGTTSIGTLPPRQQQQLHQQYFQCLTKSLSHKRREVNLAILLLRCAVACTQRETLCCPIPQRLAEQQDASLLAHVLSLPYFDGTQATTTTTSFPWWALFLSLAWIVHGHLDAAYQKSLSSDDRSLRFVLKLQLNYPGNETPRWRSLAKQTDSRLRTYHGTKIQHLWSILHYGLQPVAKENSHKLRQVNGAALGEGIYLSPTWKLAFTYAQKTPANNYVYAQALQTALHHLALYSVLNLSASFDLSKYTIHCFPVLEATALVSQNKNASNRQEGQFVITSPHNVRLEHLHLQFVLEQRTEMAQWKWILGIVLTLVAVFVYRR